MRMLTGVAIESSVTEQSAEEGQSELDEIQRDGDEEEANEKGWRLLLHERQGPCPARPLTDQC